jgi:hypothetical protein
MKGPYCCGQGELKGTTLSQSGFEIGMNDAGSPAIDASDPATATEADIEGTPAVGVRDVGAYEAAAN